MPSKNIHNRPFDKGTLAKLEIFEDYAQAWIPTFVMSGEPEIHIFDFFSGPGYDCNNTPGSPIRILQKINDHIGQIFQKKTKIVFHTNEFEPNRVSQKKYEQLIQNCDAYLFDNPKFKYFFEIKYYNKPAEELFFDLLPLIKQFPSLVFLDQNGVKFVSKKYLDEIESINKADFLYFISSSYFTRFNGTKEFQNVLNLQADELIYIEYRNIHRFIIDKLKRDVLSKDSNLKLYPYSIKKGSNIYGLIFCATHPRAVDKFLAISWRKNEINGEADFDIDNEKQLGQLDFFSAKRYTKVDKFKNDLRNLILNGTITNNEQALIYTYETGNNQKYANECVKDMRKDGKIDYDSKVPAIMYDYVFKQKKLRLVEYKVLKK
jgi:three-Cys-motif partner protein